MALQAFEAVIYPSAARTSTPAAIDLPQGVYRMLAVAVSITAISGTDAALTIFVSGISLGGAVARYLPLPTLQQIGSLTLFLAPLSNTPAINALIEGTSPSITFSVTAYAIGQLSLGAQREQFS